MEMNFLWATGITILNCYSSKDMATFAYSMLAAVAILTLEPWVIMINTTIATVLLNSVLFYSPDISLSGGMLIQAVSTWLLANVIGFVCFNSKVDRIRLSISNDEKLLQIQRLNENLVYNSIHDALTSAYNRRFLTEHIESPLSVSPDIPSGILMLDIDFFKKINDNYGHQQGDLCLQGISSLIEDFLITENDYVVRYGGEEFLVFYQNIFPQELAHKAELLRLKIEKRKYKQKDGTDLTITVSIGYASAAPDTNYYQLIEIADQNLYKAKNNGRNQIYPPL